jgi:GNAT superfamily N-acetyltransferase
MSAPAPARLDPAGNNAAAAVLGRAFFDDPLFVYFFPDAERRACMNPLIFGVGIRYAQVSGEVWTIPGTATGTAVWLPPVNPRPSEDGLEKAGLGIVLAQFTADELARFDNYVTYTDAAHVRITPQPHWYLFMVGVDPDHQGKGIGSAVLRPIFARADAEGMPCALETMNGRNVPFYERQGFAVLEHTIMPHSDIEVWVMRREPNE